MSRICEICKRKSLRGKSRSHSNIATLRRQYLNLQTKVIDGKNTKICTNCLKTLLKKEKPTK